MGKWLKVEWAIVNVNGGIWMWMWMRLSKVIVVYNSNIIDFQASSHKYSLNTINTSTTTHS